MSVPPTFLGQLFTRKLFAFAGNSLLVYDYLLTLPLEIEYIWNAPWSIIKTFFLINRYGNLIGQTFVMLEETGYLSHGSLKFCIAFEGYYTFFSLFSGELIRVLVLIRACAILGCRLRIAVLWSILYVLSAVGVVAVSAFLLSRAQSVPFEYLDEVGVCFVTISHFVAYVWTSWFIVLFPDGVMFVIVCCGLYRLYRLSPGRSPSRLVRLLARDAIIFYSAALFSVLFTIVCWNMYNQDPRNFLAALISYPFLSAIGQRLILNLRHVRAHPDSTRDLSREVNRQIAALRAERSDHLGSDLNFELGELGSGGSSV